VTDERLPSFDLVVATVDRVGELERLLASLEAQTYRAFRVLLVDQNGDDRIQPILGERDLEVVRLRADRGLSHARNAAPFSRPNSLRRSRDDSTAASTD
jgi:glycosyltransferase involved in cell wall biosynthesis